MAVKRFSHFFIQTEQGGGQDITQGASTARRESGLEGSSPDHSGNLNPGDMPAHPQEEEGHGDNGIHNVGLAGNFSDLFYCKH